MVDEANQAFGGPTGRDGLVAHVKGFRRNVGDLRLTIDRIVAGTDDVMAWWSFTGTHVGPWLGRPPTGEEISGTTFSFFDLVDGRISRYRVWLLYGIPSADEPLIVSDAGRLAAGTITLSIAVRLRRVIVRSNLGSDAAPIVAPALSP